MTKYRKIRDARDRNHGEIVAFLKCHGIEVIETERPVDCLVFNDTEAGWLEIKDDTENAKILRSQLEFMSETNMPCAFAKNEGEALAFALTMDGLTAADKNRLTQFLIRNQAKEWRTSVIEKVLKGERV